MIAKKINTMKNNKSLGVDGIPPKLLKEIVEQFSKPLANGRGPEWVVQLSFYHRRYQLISSSN